MTDVDFFNLLPQPIRDQWLSTHGPITLLDTLDDLDAAVERLRDAGTDVVEERRALRESLAVAHELREYLAGETDGERQAWSRKVANSHEGRVVEGLMYVRGRRAHEFTRHVAYPSRHTSWVVTSLAKAEAHVDSVTLRWRLDFGPLEKRRGKAFIVSWERYCEAVADFEVLDTLDVARRWLRAEVDAAEAEGRGARPSTPREGWLFETGQSSAD